MSETKTYFIKLNKHYVKDKEARDSIETLNTSLNALGDRVTALEGSINDLRIYIDEEIQDLKDYVDEKIEELSRKIIVELESVAVTGTVAIGQTLTAVTTPEDATVDHYQWYRGGTAIQGATGKSYTIVEADRGYSLKVRAYQDETHYVESPYTSKLASWTRKNVDITLTDHTPYDFGKTVRNVVGTISVSGSGNTTTNGMTLQLGVSTEPNIIYKMKSQWTDGKAQSYTYNDTFAVTNNQEITQLEMGSWASAFSDSGVTGFANVSNAVFKITSYEVLE